MIITVEGPSAAGKTTWIYNHFDQSIINDELRIENTPHEDTNADEIATFWAGISKRRWLSVCKMETEVGTVVCDSDPFKLHYVWSLWQIGKVGDDRWQAEKSATRKLFANDELGVSDLLLISIPDKTALESHARSDPNRSRPNFNLHAQLSEPLRDWYKAIELLDSQRVHWEFPYNDTDEIMAVGARENRSGTDLFDTIMANLPAS